MEWINVILPIFTLIIGFVLAQFGELFKERKEKKKKFKKLLFNLLRLHFVLKREYETEKIFERYTNEAILRLPLNLREEATKDLITSSPKILKSIKKNNLSLEKVTYLEKNIDVIIEDLAEIFPIFAFELIEEFKIKERLQQIENYLNSMAEEVNELPPPEISDWLNLQIKKTAIERLEEYIKRASVNINRKTKNATNEMLNEDSNNIKIDEDLINKFIDEFNKTHNL
ncbi:MAG: hypothetical protein LCH35_07375 [Bacteroidetes bacterium]|uniref:hypothetical protein n=1 Tax=Flavobacterium sp. TaxID=239 RepID=UPI002FDA7B92|nr:hypothetical protein [Bacteroidota bacterium]